MRITLGFCILLFIGGLSCTDNTNEDRITILNYLDSNGLVGIDTSGVFVVIQVPGSVEKPAETSSLRIKYTGYYIDGVVFDQSTGSDPVLLKLSSAVKGLRIGLRKFGKNSKGTILIPSDQGYANNPPFGIRHNAILIYDVEVLDFF